jgi:RNA polymerase sigma factor (sigma-70 family)
MAKRTCNATPPPAPQGRPTFDEVHAQGAAYVYRTLWRLGVAEADCPDAAQDVFVIVHRRLPAYQPRNRLRAWLRKIAAGVAGEYRRKREREDVMDREVDVASVAEPPIRAQVDVSEGSARRELAMYLLQQVEPEKLRPILVMHDLEEMTSAEIAEELGLTEEVVEKRLHRARAEFKAAWERLQALVRRQTGGATILPLCSALALLEAEREIPPLPKETLQAGWARLQHLVDGGSDGGGSGEGSASSRLGPAAAPGSAAPLATTTVSSALGGRFAHGLGLGLVVGLIVGMFSVPLRSTWDKGTDTLATTQSAPAAAQSAVPFASVVPSSAASTFASAAPSSPASTSASTSGMRTQAERLLDKAAAALADEDTAEALANVNEAAQLARLAGGDDPRVSGRLLIETLLRDGHVEEARTQIELFGREFPDDAQLPAFRAAAGASP